MSPFLSSFTIPSLIFSLFASSLIPFSVSLPFILLHGIGDQCSSRGVKSLTQDLIDFSKSEGFCVEVGDVYWDSWFKPLQDQTQIVCNKVKQMQELHEGYNIVGFAQVRNFVSLGGPHTGTALVPLCGVSKISFGFLTTPLMLIFLKASLFS